MTLLATEDLMVCDCSKEGIVMVGIGKLEVLNVPRLLSGRVFMLC